MPKCSVYAHTCTSDLLGMFLISSKIYYEHCVSTFQIVSSTFLSIPLDCSTQFLTHTYHTSSHISTRGLQLCFVFSGVSWVIGYTTTFVTWSNLKGSKFLLAMLLRSLGYVLPRKACRAACETPAVVGIILSLVQNCRDLREKKSSFSISPYSSPGLHESSGFTVEL